MTRSFWFASGLLVCCVAEARRPMPEMSEGFGRGAPRVSVFWSGRIGPRFRCFRLRLDK